MAKTKLLSAPERFTEIEGRMAANGVDARGRVMMQARKTFDEALAEVDSFEGALAIVFAEGFEMGKASIKRRVRKPKAQAAFPSARPDE
jgi:hypothetical protein